MTILDNNKAVPLWRNGAFYSTATFFTSGGRFRTMRNTSSAKRSFSAHALAVPSNLCSSPDLDKSGYADLPSADKTSSRPFLTAEQTKIEGGG